MQMIESSKVQERLLQRWRLRNWWARRRTVALSLSVTVMSVFGLLKLGTEFWRLLWDTTPQGAIDLKIFHNLVHQWFAGIPVYSSIGTAYPPASYLMLWPFVGWLAFTASRWFWAATLVPTLFWLMWLIVRESGATTSLEQAFVALMFLAMNATGVAIGNGQLPLQVLFTLVGGLVLLQWRQGGCWRKWLAGGLLLAALVKPNMAIPFFWLVLFVPVRTRIALAVGAGYVVLTVWAASWQERGLIELMRDWIVCGVGTAAWAAENWSYGNLHSWLMFVGLERWMTPASLILCGALGVWAYRYRSSDLWLLLGVTAYITRFWTYHGIYDDVLILLPMMALFRVAKRGPSADKIDLIAGTLLAITILVMMFPTRMFFWPWPWYLVFTVGHTIIWIAGLVFLLARTQSEVRRNASA